MTKQDVLDLIQRRLQSAKRNLSYAIDSESMAWQDGYKTALEDILKSVR